MSVVPIIVFRRPDDYLRAFYQKRVAMGCLPMAEFAHYARRQPIGLRYSENAALFRTFFPQTCCLIYEDLGGLGGLCPSFFAALGVKPGELSSDEVVRKSPTPEATLVKNYANRFLATRRQSRRFMNWLQSPSVLQSIQFAFGNRKFDLWPSHELRSAFLEGRKADVHELRRRFFPERDQLFPPLRPEDTAERLPEIPHNVRKMVLDYFGR